MVDTRFAPPEAKRFKPGPKQGVQRFDYNIVQPTTKSDTKYEFVLPNSQAITFGPETGFLIKGVFECRAKPTDDNKDPAWDVVPATDYLTCVLQPNWFEHLIKSVDVYHENKVLNPHNVPQHIDPFLNTYLYAHMDKSVKRHLCPEGQHTGNAVPTTSTSWAAATNSDWHTYSQKVFGKSTVTFRWNPMFVFPFYQDANFCERNEPVSLPMPTLGQIKVNVRLKDKTNGIFRKTVATNTKEYRFRLIDMELVLMEATLSNQFEKAFNQSKKTLPFPGVTKIGTTENINPGVNSARYRLANIPYPEGIFIVALSKKAGGGDYLFSEATSTTGKIFSYHNIQSIEVKYNDSYLSNKTPNIGNINHHIIEIKQAVDHLNSPPFGVMQDPDKLQLEKVKEGSKETLYPHIYINLCPSGRESRIIPVGDDGHAVNKGGDISLEIKFYSDGAPSDVVFVFYAFFTDINMVLDMKTREFEAEYNTKL